MLYGGWGLFAISFLDSSFLSFPLINDLLLLHLSSQRPDRVLIYVLQSTAGSVLGAYVIYAISRRGGQLLWGSASPGNKSRAGQWLERNDFAAVLVASLLPPPAPFKVFLITAGALRVNPARFGAALLVGRGVRFAAEGLLAARYGARAEIYLKENIAWVSLLAAALVVMMVLVYRQVTKQHAERPGSSGLR